MKIEKDESESFKLFPRISRTNLSWVWRANKFGRGNHEYRYRTRFYIRWLGRKITIELPGKFYWLPF